MAHIEPITDLDLMAYADGLLERDPVRRRQVEAHLNARPELGRRVAIHQAQNRALEEAFGPRIEEPVPERLLSVLARSPARPIPTAMRAAALAALVLAAGTLGWSLSQLHGGPEGSTEAFVQQTYRTFTKSPQVPAPGLQVAQASGPQSLDWLRQEILIELPVPDLAEAGFALVAKRTIDDGEGRILRLTYADAEERRFDLFIRPRWQGGDERLQVTREDDVSIAYWLEGPLASAVASDLPPDETVRIAETVRQSIGRGLQQRPASGPTGPIADGVPGGRPGAPALQADAAIPELAPLPVNGAGAEPVSGVLQ